MQGNNTLDTCELTTPSDRGINHLWSCDTRAYGFGYATRWDDKPYSARIMHFRQRAAAASG